MHAIRTRPNLAIATIMMMIAASPIFAVGTVQQTTQAIGRDTGSGPDNRIYAISIYWTADATVGTVPSTAISLLPAMQGMRLVAAEIKPGTPSPSSNYSVTLTDGIGADLFTGAGASLSATASSSLSISVLAPPLFGGLTFNLSGNSVNGATGTVLAYFAPQSQITVTPGAPGLGVNNTFTGVNSFSQINKTVIVDGTVYPKTDAGINAAIAAAGCGGHVFMPTGTYVLSDTTRAQEILISSNNGCGLELNGEGGEQTILQIAANVPNTEDVIRVAPTGTNMFGLYLHDFYILPASGTPARYGINFDETGTGIAHVVVDRIRIGGNATLTTGNYAIFNTNTVPQCNSLFLASFHHNTFWGGVNFNNIGDSVTFSDGNNVTGPRDFRVQTAAASCHTDGGTHGFVAEYNNLTPAGGIVIVNAWQGRLAYNDMEATVTSTETNNALVDVQGQVANPIENFIIEGNYVGASNLFVADGIRVDQSFHTIIRNNYLIRGTGVGIRLTANAARTEIMSNTEAPNTDPITTWLADGGTLTTIDSMHVSASDGARILSNAGFGTTGSTNANFFFNGVQGKANSSSLWGFTSAADAANSGLDTGMSRDSAGVVDVGNGVALDTSGTVNTSIYIAHSNVRFNEVTAPATFAGVDICYGDSTAHAVKCNYNNTNFFPQTQTIASGTATLTTAAIAAGACGTTVTVAAANVATTDTITWAFNAAPGGQNAGLVAWPTSGNVNFAYCSNTAETPAAATANWRVVR